MILWWVAMVSCFYACDDSSTNTDPGLPLPGDFGQHVDQSLMHDAESRFDSGGTDIDALLSDSSMNTQDLNIPNDFSLRDQGVERFDRAVPQEPTLASTFFAGTHNSYSGGARGSVTAQLNHGIRCLEFDFHDNDFERLQAYRLGHSSHESEVELGEGNPETTYLSAWLGLVSDWSLANRGHGPIILLLDAKDNLRDNYGPELGNLGYLNQLLVETFGDRLLRAGSTTEWASISNYSDKIIIVLSGDRTTRKAYIVDEGVDPAVATHGSGRVLTMHSDGGERLWYWTGRLSEDGESIQWLHHGRYDTGAAPALVFVNRDTVIEVHRSHSRDRLFAALGRLNEQGRITWFEERSLFDGKSPSLSLTSDGRIHLIYEERGSSGRRRQAYGQVTGESVTFDASTPTTSPLFQTSNTGEIEVTSSDINGNNERTLLYRFATQRDFDFIRYEQLMFTEYQSGDDSFLAENARFAGFGSGNEGALEQHNARYVTRLWSYDAGDARSALQPNLLSTDEPFAPWFDEQMRDLSAIDW